MDFYDNDRSNSSNTCSIIPTSKDRRSDIKMLYDIKAHLPQLMDKLLVEDFRAGDIIKLVQDKTLITKLLGDDTLDKKLALIEQERDKQKNTNEKKVIEQLQQACNNDNGIDNIWMEIEKTKNIYVENIDRIERDYWETIIGELTRTINKIPTPEQ